MRTSIKLFVLAVATMFMFTGCAALVTRMLVPDVNTHLRDTELSHLKDINKDYNDKIVALADKKTDKKTKLALAKLLYKGNKTATDIKPSAAENMMQQYARMAGREGLEQQIGVGIEWTTGLISQVAGGGAIGLGGIGTILALLRGRSKKNRALRIVSSELDEVAKAKVKKALEHTGAEREIT